MKDILLNTRFKTSRVTDAAIIIAVTPSSGPLILIFDVKSYLSSPDFPLFSMNVYSVPLSDLFCDLDKISNPKTVRNDQMQIAWFIFKALN